MQKFNVFYNLICGETIGIDQKATVEADTPEQARNIVKRNYALQGMKLRVHKIKKVKP